MKNAAVLARACIVAGADYVKFQLYDSMRLFKGTEDFYAATVEAELTKSQARLLLTTVAAMGGRCMFSVFDAMRLIWVAELDKSIHLPDRFTPIKIGSRSTKDQNLIDTLRTVGVTKMWRPWRVFISDGFGRLPDPAYDKLAPEVYWMYCKPEYPCVYTEQEWQTIEEGFKTGHWVGFSDHSIGTEAMKRAAALGAKVIEKHITFDRAMPGPDHKLSITPLELRDVIKEIRAPR